MPLGKNDNPTSSKASKEGGEATSDADVRDAQNAAIDAAAGAPDASRDEAEALPEKDDVQKEIKKSLTAEDAQTEAKAKAKVVDLSPDAAETPSGRALKKTAGISDDVERGEAYAREKQAARWGTQPVDEDK